MNLIVGVSDAKVSGRRDDVITTHALGSCIGVALYDAVAGAAGLLHFQLPTSTMDGPGGTSRPLMFADTGMKVLLDQLAKLGADKKRMKVRMAGGAKMLNDASMFDIGRRNHAAIRKVLFMHGMFIDHEMVGGNEPITMQLHVAGGELVLKRNRELFTL